MTRLVSFSLLMPAALVLFGCANSPAVPHVDLDASALPPIAAQYRTTHRINGNDGDGHRRDHADEHRTDWRIWREPDRITTENLDVQTGEVWQRDGTTLFHQKLFHADRRSVEFQMDDMRMAQVPLSWPRQALVIDPQLLARLPLRRSGWHKGYPYRRYVGESDGSQWDITIRTDLMLPASILRKRPDAEELTQLQEVHPLQSAPWSPTPRDDYEVLDFADLGDRQGDPFVVKVQDQLGRPHTH